MTRAGTIVVAGRAEGTALVLAEPLSFWGGIDVETGAIIDHSHPARGASVTGRILVMPCGRGSSSSASVFAESIRRGTGPDGVLLARADPILTVGAMVAATLYGRDCPIVVCDIAGIADGDVVAIDASADAGDGTVAIRPA
ncbi:MULTISPECIES: aconitase X swivel domain-containing protein [Aurantimonas]|uniref:aconitase X swivel domain-containing protein n=1 Tax=Aurantimonas TaxID=182269 RepID=UPI003512E35C